MDDPPRARFDPTLCYVTGDRSLDTLADRIDAAIRGGVTVVQLRLKSVSPSEMVDLCQQLKPICAAAGVPLLVNDRVDVALEAKLDGVHLGQDDMPVVLARAFLGPDAIIGLSVRKPAEVVFIPPGFVDYVAANGVFPTGTKKDLGRPIGLRGVRRLRKAATMPLMAIGGITAANAPSLRRAGVDGIAAVSAIDAAAAPDEAARRLKSAFTGA